MARESPESVAQWLEAVSHKFPSGFIEDYARNHLDHGLGFSPRELLALAEALPRGHAKNFAAQSGVASLTRRDPHAAIDWAETHLDGETLDLAFTNIASVWASTHPAAAADWVEALDSRPITDHLLRALIQPLAGQNPERAWRLARYIQDPYYREKVVLAAMTVLTHTDPAAAQAEIKNLPINDRARPVTRAPGYRVYLLRSSRSPGPSCLSIPRFIAPSLSSKGLNIRLVRKSKALCLHHNAYS